MSADLLAEFEEFAKPPPPVSTREPPHEPKPIQASSSGSRSLGVVADTATASTDGQSRQVSQAAPTPQQHAPADPWASLSGLASSTTTLNTEDDEDDDWGEFEVAQPSSQPSARAPLAPTTTTTTTRTKTKAASPVPETQPPAFKQPPALSRTRVVRAPTIELVTNSLVVVDGLNKLPEDARTPSWMRAQFENKPIEPPQGARSGKPKKVSDILFDAEDFDSHGNGFDDEFGDFESVTSPAGAPANSASVDLFPSGSTGKPPARPPSNLNLKEPLSPYPQAPRSPSFHDRNPFPGLAVTTPIEPKKAQEEKPKTSPITAWPTFDQGNSAGSNTMDDDWGAFGDLPEDSAFTAKSKTENDSWDWDAFDEGKPTAAQPQGTVAPSAPLPDTTWDWNPINLACVPSEPSDDKAAPPINIPPPAVLLSIFPYLLGQADTVLYKPIGKQPFSVKTQILSDPRTIEYLRGYISLATVAARIIAGRKQRWHRDKFLAQGMSISAAGSKGMKLAGIDKSQAAREDREAADILDIWKENVGRLRSSVATANAAAKDTPTQLKVSELRENMPVQTAKGVPTAPKACVICGLRREERIARVDFDVEDSFGEFWIDHWGHTACKRFWQQHERDLRQR